MKRTDKRLDELVIDKLHFYQSKDSVKEDGKQTCDFFNKKNRTMMFATSILFIALSIFWLLTDLIVEHGMILDNANSFAGNLLLFVSSVLMLLYQIVFWGKVQRKPVIYYTAYYTLIIASVCFLTIGHNIKVAKMLDSGSISNDANFITYLTKQTGIYLSTFCLLAICLAPLPRKFHIGYFGVLLAIECIVPAIGGMPGSKVYPLLQHLVVNTCFVGIYVFMYFIELRRCLMDRHLELISYTDQLTKALNRTALETYIGILKKKEDKGDIGIILFDIDDFKKYNDTYSHPEGDKVLNEVISIAFDNIDKEKHLLFRYGGEEFVILLNNSNKEETINTANKIRKAVEDAKLPRDDGGLYPYITITIGAELSNVNKPNFIRKVDEQLYIGKKSNKNCVVYNGEIVRK